MSVPDVINGEKLGDVEITTSSTNGLSSSSQSSAAESESSQVVLCREPDEIQLPVGLVEEMGESESTDAKEYYCGVGGCRPKWLQVFRNAYFFTVILCLNCAIEGAIVSGK